MWNVGRRAVLGLAIVAAMPWALAAGTEPLRVAALEALPLPKVPQPIDHPARATPVRAYAVDGCSFYFEGRRMTVDGLDASAPEMATEFARQRLQLVLDAGEMVLEAAGEAPDGTILARVTVDGREITELLR